MIAFELGSVTALSKTAAKMKHESLTDDMKKLIVIAKNDSDPIEDSALMNTVYSSGSKEG